MRQCLLSYQFSKRSVYINGLYILDKTAQFHDEIRERMSGNLCRCAAYANIVPAIAEVLPIRSPDAERRSGSLIGDR
ncbi:MAG TPA: 2Fe-2S iron-sulfur cluster-binding protein, partial [Ktedonobacteraceae bacterium]|nr:2Fe-2S iron-sulfur cluster-binding protein [Ktedonobacteraceae bacterium]